MKNLYVSALCALGAILACLELAPGTLKAAEPEYPLHDLVECSPRGGLPNFFRKLQSGEEVAIGYLGGSITAQNGWRILSQDWFQKAFPQAKVRRIDAAIGGTGSGLGVFRLERDVLRHKPDLLFVEFAVNDSSAGVDQIIKSMEGIVRQTWKTNPECDICFVYTVVERDMPTLHSGKMKRSSSVMEAVADHYGIPSIHLGVEITKLEGEGKLVMKGKKGEMTRVSGDELNEEAKPQAEASSVIVFSGDGVHPHPGTGHKLYMAAIERSVPIIKAQGNVGPHQLPAPIDPDNWEMACMIPIQPDMFTGPAEVLPKDNPLAKMTSSTMPALWEAKPDSVLTFRFKGSRVSIYDLLSPRSGLVEIIVDGEPKKVKRMDGYSTYSRIGTLSGAGDLDPEKVHTVQVKVLDETFDKKQVLFERNRANYDEKPENYATWYWYPGAIMLVGELVDE